MNKTSKEMQRNLMQIIAEDFKEVQSELINEAVNHFIGSRSREIEDDPRYLIGDSELSEFKQRYKQKIIEYENKNLNYTKLEDLHIRIVEELSRHNEPYYEIGRQKYYNMYPEFFFGE